MGTDHFTSYRLNLYHGEHGDFDLVSPMSSVTPVVKNFVSLSGLSTIFGTSGFRQPIALAPKAIWAQEDQTSNMWEMWSDESPNVRGGWAENTSFCS